MSTALSILKQIITKAGKVALKGLKLVGQNAGKFISMAKSFAAANPEIAAWLVTQAVDTSLDKVKEFVTQKGLDSEPIMKTLMALEAVAGGIAIEKVAGANRNKGRTNNHPTDWFKDGVKLSATAESNAPASRMPNVDRWVSRHFYVTKAASVSENNFMYQPTMDGFYQAYKSWYKRYENLQPSSYQLKTAEQVEQDINKIFRNSWVAISILHEMTRSQSAYDVQVNQTDGFGRALCGPNAYAFSFQVANETIKDEIHNKGGIAGLVPTTTTLFGSIRECDVTASATSILSYTEERFNYGMPKISSYEWNKLIEKAKKLILSDNTYNISKYLFSQVFTDYNGEDDMEFYTFHAPLFAGEVASEGYEDGALDIALTGPTPVTSVTNFLDAFNRAYSIVQTTYNSDPAYASILTMMGFTPESSSISTGKSMQWRGLLKDDMRRDVSGKTLHLVEADDSLYLALLNANYYVKTEAFIQEEVEGAIKTIPDVVCLKNYSAYADSSVLPTKISFGKLPKLPIEKLTKNASKHEVEEILNSGEIAAATKFCSVMALALGPIIVFDGNGAPAIANPTNPILPVDGGFEDYKVASEIFTSATIRVMKFGILPCGITPYFTANKNTYIIGGYKRDNWGYDQIASLNLKGLEEVQWTNLFLGLQTFEEVSKALAIIKNVNAVTN